MSGSIQYDSPIYRYCDQLHQGLAHVIRIITLGW
jgi:hypothetical protein